MSLLLKRIYNLLSRAASLVLLVTISPPYAHGAAQFDTGSSTTAIISGGIAHTCAITAAGGVQCWGQGNRLGLPEDADDSTAPVHVAGLPGGVRAVAAGSNHTCALTADGHALCWSDNTFGELGDGTTTFSALPTSVTNLPSGASAIGSGDDASCAVLVRGGVACWGTNDSGELGDGTTTERDAPVDVMGLSGPVAAVVTRSGHTCALLSSGGVTCWGRNLEGELGNGTEDSSVSPVMVSGLTSGASGVAAGTLHTCATLASGGVRCWGQDDSGELGDGHFSSADRLKPVAVVGLTEPVTAITAGNAHTCVLTNTGGVKCWGTNNQGQLGDGTTEPRNTPVDVVGLQRGVVAIGAGYEHTCAILNTGAIKCWGNNSHGQLGDGTFTQRTTPVQVIYRIFLPINKR